ncbi:putative ribonuclease H-like domain-containing protein [Tanacetum coccineum]
MVSTIKLPILKKGEYTLWSMRMEQYLTNIDYSLWQVILNGDGPIQVTTNENGVETEVPPKTAQALLQRQRERKAKSILLLAIPDEYQLRFHGIKDAKSLWAAIKSRFGGNVESKKMQKTVLKQQFENFFVSDTEGLDKAYDRFQKLISLLEVHGAVVPNEDANQKFLRALPSSWNNVALIMRNKDGIDDLDIDDLYNNLKVFEADIKGQCFDCLRWTGGQNLINTQDTIILPIFFYDWSYIAQDEPTEFALMAYTSNSSGSDTELGLESVEAQLVVHQKNEALYEEKIAVLEFKVKDKSNVVTRLKNYQLSSKDKTDLGYGDQLNEKDSSGSELFNSVFDSRSSDGDDNQTNDRPTTNKTSASVSQVETSTSQTSNTSVNMPRVKSGRPSGVIIEDWVSDDEDIFQSNDLQATYKPSFKRIEFTNARNESVKPKQAEKPRIITQNPKVDRRDWKEKITQKLGLGFGQTAVSTVKGTRVTAVKASAGCVWRPKMTDLNNVSKDNSGSWVSKRGNPQQALKNKGIFDSGCSRHMTGNKDFLTDYQDIDGGFVAFGGSARGGKITGKGKIRTDKLDFEDVFFVKELKFNLFSVSQMCDKKNNVLFTEMNMLHMDLFGPTSVRSINHKTYCLVVTDDFSRFSWVFFLATKSETSGILKKFITEVENQLNHKVKVIRSDNGTEFKNREMDEFCGQKGIKREYSVARTPQQNRVAERKNRTLIEAARTMLADSLLPTVFWAEAVNTACYVLNRVLVTKPHNKTPYELIIGRAPSISFMRPFGCPVTILNTLDPLGKFDGKAEEGFLVGYSVNSKAFRVFNTETRKVEENLHVNFLENKPNVAGQGPNWLFDIDSLTNSMNYQPVTAGNQTNKNAGPQETNGNTGLKKNVDAGQTEEENVSTQQYIVFPLWSSISSSYKSSDDKAKDYTVDDDACRKTVQEPASEYDQALKNVLDKMMDQEKEATEQSNVVRKEFEAQCDSQEKITRASSTNSFNTVSTPVNTASASRTFSLVGPSSGPSFVPFGGSFPIDVANLPHDPLMPELEDTVEIQSTGIFGNAYDDHDLETLNTPYANQSVGAEADFNNMEPSTVFSHIPTTRVHSIYPKAQIIRDPKSAVQTRGMKKKNSREHAMISYIQKQRRINHKDF